MIKLNDREFASMIVELAKMNEDSNKDIQNIELLSNSSIDIFIYVNRYCDDYIVCIYTDYLYNNEDTLCAELYFSVQREVITCDKVTTSRLNVTYLHAINQH